tara:strand:- start:47 stop:364 length:318 start_codon:yes stop_codon:yes gene_type:complete
MEKVKKFIQNIPKPLKNKYIITLTAFTFWILFIDDYNLIKQYQLQKNVKELENKRTYYLNEIKKDSTELFHILNTKAEQERFAREKFLMKKDNEDIFIIKTEQDE